MCTTATNQYGSEVMVEPISGWLVNDTTICIVVSKVTNQGSMAIEKGKAVISGHGSSKDFIDSNINVGDTISVIQLGALSQG